MDARLKAEIELVKAKYPDVQYGDNPPWVFIPDFSLQKDILNKEKTRLLFMIPPGYPVTAPDDFFVDAELRLANGEAPPNFNNGSRSSNGSEAPIGESWAWFSWHPNGWRPASEIQDGDNLLSYIRGVSMCLRGE